MACAGCEAPVCAAHAGYLKRGFWCEACFTRERNKGVMIAWIAVTALIAAALLAMLLLA